VTKLDDIKEHKNIDKIDGLSRYGTLLKIQKSDIVAGYNIYEKTKVFNVNYMGLTFARYYPYDPGFASSTSSKTTANTWLPSRFSTTKYQRT